MMCGRKWDDKCRSFWSKSHVSVLDVIRGKTMTIIEIKKL